jgi:ATPase family associated with various cellular activities (AAA)
MTAESVPAMSVPVESASAEPMPAEPRLAAPASAAPAAAHAPVLADAAGADPSSSAPVWAGPLPAGPVPVDSMSAEPAWLSEVRLRAGRRALWLRSLWAGSPYPGENAMAISHSEVDRAMAPAGELAEAERRFYREDATAAAVSGALDRLLAAGPDARWAHLTRMLGLPAADASLLALALAAEAAPEMRRVYGYLGDETGPVDASPALARALWDWPPGLQIGPGSALLRWRLAWPRDGGQNQFTADSGWVADPLLLAELIGDGLAARSGPVGRDVELAGEPVLYPAALDEIVGFAGPLSAATGQLRLDSLAGQGIEVELAGPPGSGKTVLAAQACQKLGKRLVCVDAAGLAGHPDPVAVAVREARQARLHDSVLTWQRAHQMPDVAAAAVDGLAELAFFETDPAESAPARPGRVRLRCALPAPDRDTRRRLWSALSGEPAPLPVTEWTLLPGEVATAARVLPAGEGTVRSVLRRSILASAPDLLTPVPLPCTWDDLVLAPHVTEHLRELEARVRLRGEVLDGWDLADLTVLGRGVSALFAGPSGCGKTMAAQVLARSLDLELYRVDLAGVVSKYIGETEKHLRTVFDACQRAPVLLLFDEADALFGKRTQVKDAHDRFANIEIDYLLQRMERFDGLAVLATNRKADLDSAFLRRLRFVIDFVPPGAAERERLWRRALAGRTDESGVPIVDDLDWTAIGAELELSAADIKSAALAAAFLARSQGTRVGLRHVLAAARRELEKRQIVVRPGQLDMK